MANPTLSEIGLLSAALYVAYHVTRWCLARRRRMRNTTPLRGPRRLHPIWGWSREIMKTKQPAELFEGFVEEYGSVVGIPTLFWNQTIQLADPKAVAHFYAHDASVYVRTPFAKAAFARLLGRENILSADGDKHKRLRKALSPAFSLAAIRRLTDIFYDSTLKAKSHWDTILDSHGSKTIIDVQDWMNRISLDSIGTAGFSHDFNSLDGHPSAVVDMFHAFHHPKKSAIGSIAFLLSLGIPFLVGKIPTAGQMLMKRFNDTMVQTAEDLMNRTKEETKALGEHSAVAEKSIIGLLIKAESSTDSHLSMTKDEISAQMSVLLFAGHETTSTSLTWALVELARNPHIQEELRKEIHAFASSERYPTYDELIASSSTLLPTLDGVVQETLRLHSPTLETSRMATQDDVIPLSRPYITPNGTVVDKIHVAKGTIVSVSIGMINRSRSIWGPDAKEFKPSRWFDPATKDLPAMEFAGYRHLLTFADGRKMCLGKSFAVAEFKAVLFVLMKFYSFEFPNGPETEIDYGPGFIKRPKVAGEPGIRVPLLVKRL